MNQIIYTSGTKSNSNENTKTIKRKNTFFKIQLYILIIVIISLIIYYSFYRYDLNNQDKFAKSIMDTARNY